MTGPGVVGHSGWTVQWHTSRLAFRTVARSKFHARRTTRSMIERYERGDCGRTTGRGWYDDTQPTADAKATTRAG